MAQLYITRRLFPRGTSTKCLYGGFMVAGAIYIGYVSKNTPRVRYLTACMCGRQRCNSKTCWFCCTIPNNQSPPHKNCQSVNASATIIPPPPLPPSTRTVPITSALLIYSRCKELARIVNFGGGRGGGRFQTKPML